MNRTDRVAHTEFSIDRQLGASPRHVFRFWSEAPLKARWNGCHPEWGVEEDAFDFRVGGSERRRWRTAEGDVQTFTAHYLDIVPERRIIYAYEMSFAGRRLSASLVTVTFEPHDAGTLMRFTEQVAILEGGADAREQRLLGTEQGIDRLVELVAMDGPAPG